MSTSGAHHIGLAVSRLDDSARFFVEGLGWTLVRRVPEYPAVCASDGTPMVTVWQVLNGARPFDRQRNVGLHHLARRVADEATLHALSARLAARDGVRVEFGPEPLRGGPAQHMMCYDSSGVRIEPIHVPA